MMNNKDDRSEDNNLKYFTQLNNTYHEKIIATKKLISYVFNCEYEQCKTVLCSDTCYDYEWKTRLHSYFGKMSPRQYEASYAYFWTVQRKNYHKLVNFDITQNPKTKLPVNLIKTMVQSTYDIDFMSSPDRKTNRFSHTRMSCIFENNEIFGQKCLKDVMKIKT